MRYFSKIQRKHLGNSGKIRRYSPGLLQSFRRKPGDGFRKTARRRVEGGIFLGRFSEKGTGCAEDSDGISVGPFEKPARRQRRGTAFPPGMHSFSTGFSTEIRRAGAFVTHVGTSIARPVCGANNRPQGDLPQRVGRRNLPPANCVRADRMAIDVRRYGAVRRSTMG